MSEDGQLNTCNHTHWSREVIGLQDTFKLANFFVFLSENTKLICVLICFWVKTGAAVFCAPRVPNSPVSIICCYFVISIFSTHSQPELFIITSWLALRRILLPHFPPAFFCPSPLSLLEEKQELPYSEKHWLFLSLCSHDTSYTAIGDYVHLEKRLKGVGLLRLAGRWVRGYIREK